MASEGAFETLLGKILKRIPQDPLIQTKYLYYLNGIILLTLLGFTGNNFYYFFFAGHNFSYLFGGILTTVFFLMSLFSFNSTRQAYLMIKNQKNMMGVITNMTPEQMEEMLAKEKEVDQKEVKEDVQKS